VRRNKGGCLPDLWSKKDLQRERGPGARVSSTRGKVKRGRSGERDENVLRKLEPDRSRVLVESSCTKNRVNKKKRGKGGTDRSLALRGAAPKKETF